MSQRRDDVDPDNFRATPGPIEETETATARDTRVGDSQEAVVRERDQPDSMEAAPETPVQASPDGEPNPDLGTLGTRADPMR